MIEILALSALIGVFCNGLILVTSEGQLLYPVRQLLESLLIKTHEVVLEQGIDAHRLFHVKKKLKEPKVNPLYRPLLGCATCMPSIWGTAIYLCFAGVTPEMWYQLPVTLIASSAISTIISQQYL